LSIFAINFKRKYSEKGKCVTENDVAGKV
jgi:hypothetical protein